MTVDHASAASPGSLVARILCGERSAEEELVAQYGRGIFAIAVVRTGNRDTARDLTQDVLMAVLKSVRKGQVRESDKLAAFIQGTARNLINNHFKTSGRRAETGLDPAEFLSTDPVPELEAAERARLVREELKRYSALDQQILLFSLVDGHSLAEIADRMKLSHEAVRARKSRLVRKLARKFESLSQR